MALIAKLLAPFASAIRRMPGILGLDGLFRWIRRIYHGECILIDYYIDTDRQKFTATKFYARFSEAQAYAAGYVKGVKVLDKFSEIPFRSYVRFHPDLPPVPSRSLETASTLYDHWKSNATAKFLHGMMTKKTLAPIEMKQLIMIGIIAAAAAAGILLLVF